MSIVLIYYQTFSVFQINNNLNPSESIMAYLIPNCKNWHKNFKCQTFVPLPPWSILRLGGFQSAFILSSYLLCFMCVAKNVTQKVLGMVGSQILYAGIPASDCFAYEATVMWIFQHFFCHCSFKGFCFSKKATNRRTVLERPILWEPRKYLPHVSSQLSSKLSLFGNNSGKLIFWEAYTS